MFDIKKSDQSDRYRLIIYRNDMFNDDSIGYSVEKKQLYDLYTQLRNVFKDVDGDNI